MGTKILIDRTTKKPITLNNKPIVSTTENILSGSSNILSLDNKIIYGTRDWLKFEAAEAGSTVSFGPCSTGTPSNTVELEYSTDGINWNNFVVGETIITLANIGDYVYFRGDNETINTGPVWDSTLQIYIGYNFKMTGQIISSGNIMSLLDKTCQLLKINSAYSLGLLFMNCTSLLTAPRLPATSLSSECYVSLFDGCTSLKVAPKLPATELVEWCYESIFSGCSSLITPPQLPALSIPLGAYLAMFYNCTSLERGPDLPATNLSQQCYHNMFGYCTSLKIAPKLPAITLYPASYLYMFQNCTSLEYAPELPATTLAESTYNAMFYNCTSLKQAPNLPATTLQPYCYLYMFTKCSSLKTIPNIYATTLATYCYYAMFAETNLICYTISKDKYIKSLVVPSSLPSGAYDYMFYKGPKLNDATFPNSGTPTAGTTYYFLEDEDEQ